MFITKSPIITTATAAIALQNVQSFQISHSGSITSFSYTQAQTYRGAAGYYTGYEDDGDDEGDILPQRQPQRQSTDDGLKYQDDDDEDLTKQFMSKVSMDELEERMSAPRPSDLSNKIPVKFVNFDSDNPYEFRTALVEEGTNLMDIADDLGVPVPRSCKSGLCGACTADVYDPTCPRALRQAYSETRPGHQTIRLCTVGAIIPADCTEMVIDCYRNCESVGDVKKKPSFDAPRMADAEPVSGTPASRNTERFNEDWESEFEPGRSKVSSDTTGFSIPVDFYADDKVSTGTQITRVVTKNLRIQTPRLRKKKRRLPLAGSVLNEDLSGERYKWYLGNRSDVEAHDAYGIALKQVKKDWTYHDIDRLLGVVFKPDVSSGIAPWDEIY